MITEYDTDLALAISRQRVAELRAEADRQRLVRAMRRDGPGVPWWRRWGRRGAGRHTAQPGQVRAGAAPVLRLP